MLTALSPITIDLTDSAAEAEGVDGLKDRGLCLVKPRIQYKGSPHSS